MRRSTTAVAALLACLLTVLLAGQALATTWYPPVMLTSFNLSEAGHRALVTLGTGTVVAAYLKQSGTNRGVYVRRSGDSGATWDAQLRLSAAIGTSLPEISGHGTNVDVVWLANGHVRYARSVNGGVTFLPTRAFAVADGGTVRVARGPNGRVVIAWESCGAGTSARLRVSVDGGVTFGAVHPLVADCDIEHGVTVAVGTGVIYASYADVSDTDATLLRMVRSRDDGATWKGPVTLAGAGYEVDMAAEGADAYITYVTSASGSDPRARYRRTTDRGASWIASAYLDSSATGLSSFSPVISLNGGVVRAAYGATGCPGSTCEGYAVYYRESADGTSWTAPQAVGSESASGVGFAGRIVVLYNRFLNADPPETIVTVVTGTP